MIQSKISGMAYTGVLLALTHPALAEDEATAWRLFVADHTNPTVTAIDLDNPDQRWSFDLAGAARLYSAADGALIVAVQSNDDKVDFFRSGVELEAHGDHADIEVSDPEPIGQVTGPRPGHVVTHSGAVAIAYDRGGYAGVFSEDAVLSGNLNEQQFPVNVAHHGFVANLGDYLVASVASEEPVQGDGLPPRVGIAAYAPDGTRLGEVHTCTGLHGEAFSGVYLVAGCEEGVIAHDTTGGPDAFKMLPYPEDFPEDKTGQLVGAVAMQAFLGDYDRRSVVILDPTEAPYFKRVELPFRKVDFILDPNKPQHGYIFTEDGSLHRLNMLTAEIEASLTQLTQPYSMEGHWRDPRPRMTTAGERLILTDPLKASVRVIDLEDFTELEQISVDGTPYNLVVVGGSGLMH
ncbi:metallochaperone AztD [Cognatishimia sp. MH4019]|uniref:metallochaperone AztD n=1 Tax=Cognatishimia sp. MH4019 TaxID=2854030 RepID=UPI001CD4C750|nr:metallochaperone AztD [Cognatishimia sp. MH4019]